MMRATLSVSVLLHAAILAAALVREHDAPNEPDEPSGIEVVLGALVAPGTDAAPAPVPPVEPAPEATELSPARETSAYFAASRQIDQSMAAADGGLTSAERLLSPRPSPMPAASNAGEGGTSARAGSARERASLQAQPARSAPAGGPGQHLAPPITRPMLSENLVALSPASPGLGSEGEVLPARSAPGFRNPPPSYPDSARQRGQQGTVVIRARVDADGTALFVEVAQSSGFALLDDAAMAAVRTWRFAPATRNGAPVPDDFLARISFRLD